jgi:hypothetical protein
MVYSWRSAPIHHYTTQKSTDLEKARVELQNTKRQCELVKSLLADATAEKEIMYEVRIILVCLRNYSRIIFTGLQRGVRWDVQ